MASQYLGDAKTESRGFEARKSSHRTSDATRWDGLLGAPLGLTQGGPATCSGAARCPHSRPAPATWLLPVATLEVPKAEPDRVPFPLAGGWWLPSSAIIKPTADELCPARRARQVHFALTERCGQQCNALNPALSKT